MIRCLLIAIPIALMSINVQADTRVPEAAFNELSQAAALEAGDILYIDFWASWCAPCRKSFPWMNEMIDKYQNQGFKILAVNLDKEKALAEKFLQTTDTKFPVFYDPEGRFAELFKLKGMPSSYALSADGTILSTHKGFFTDQLNIYEGEIQALLEANQ